MDLPNGMHIDVPTAISFVTGAATLVSSAVAAAAWLRKRPKLTSRLLTGLAVLLALSTLGALGWVRFGPTNPFSEFDVPSAGEPNSIVAGPNTTLWFTEQAGNKIGRITLDGHVTEYMVPTPASRPDAIALGSDENLWFTEKSGNAIGQSDLGGHIQEYPLPTPNSGPTGITAGPYGALWFTEYVTNRIGRITTTGQIKEFALPAGEEGPWDIVQGPDNALWITEDLGDDILQMTVSEDDHVKFTPFKLAKHLAHSMGIASDGKGSLWFTEEAIGRIGRVMTNGNQSIKEFPVPMHGGQNARPWGISNGPDGNMWFTEKSGDYIGRITPSGMISEYRIPTTFSRSFGITTGGDGAMWFTEAQTDKIGRYVIPQK